ncbi:DUF222 domain-containing protein [Nocardioides sp.]|uniref:DUF222 domain-containing protein n=1 Tax=Nocardioides sp. TaxID=35761 RepID=UPI00378525BC
MVDRAALEEMTEDEVLGFAGDCVDTARRAEADLLRAAFQWAVLHSSDRLDPAERDLPGRERSKLLGGPGVPEVTEFAAAELGARIGRSTFSAAMLIADAQDLVHRHPQLWARVEAGEVKASYACYVVGKTRELEPDEAAYVDARVAESADGRIPWSRFEGLVEGAVAQAAPERAREKEERAQKAVFAKRLRGEAHGMASFLVRADVATIEAIESGFARQADALKESRPDDPDLATDDLRRVRAVLLAATGLDADGDLADVIHVEFVVHTYAGPDAEGVMRLEGHGPVTEEWVRSLLGPRARFTIQPVMDLAGQAPVDGYEVPDRHRRAVHLMTPADIFPFASSTSRSMQVDHTVPYDEGGVTGIGNYGPMTIPHHRIKTHGGWQVQQPFPGIYVWRDPHGAFYVVDHTGTRRVPSAPARRAPMVELWRAPFPIEYAA